MFISRDEGDTWGLNDGLWNHPHRARWEPGGGGLCLHTILLDPGDLRRVRVAISTGGMYVTEDGCATWRASNAGVRAEFLPDKHPEFGQCVHKVVQSKVRPERMFLQNHWGLYRSDDRGEHWVDIANGVPSDFGFGLAIHPRDADCAWIVPLESDEFRCTPEGKLRIYGTRNAGSTWEPLSNGLPQARRTRRFFVMPSPLTAWIPSGSTSARAAGRSSDRSMRGTPGPSCWTACPQ